MPDPINNAAPDDVTLIRMIVEARREEYSELSELWRHLDTKAQGVIALAGILLAAFVAFITKTQPSSAAQRAIYVVGVALFTSSLAMAALSLKIREVVGPPHFGDIESTIEDFLQLPLEERSSRLSDLGREEISEWTRCNETVQHAVEIKARFLSWSQLLISLSIVWLAVLAMISIWG